MAQRSSREPKWSPLTTLALISWGAVVVGVVLVGLGLGYGVTSQWRMAVLLVVLGGTLLSLPLQRRRMLASAQAAEQWPPSRVREALMEAGAVDASRVEQVRELRRVDRRLGLSDAVDLVSRADVAGSAGH